MKLIWAVFVFIAGLCMAAAAWFVLLSPRGLTVETVHPSRGTAIDAVYATGTTEPSVMLPIAPRVTGRLIELNADEGMHVTKGQVLARLEDEDLQKTLQEMRAEETLARQNYNRSAALFKQGYETKSTLDKMRAALDTARAGVARTESQLSYLQMLAPDTGNIIRRDGEIGQTIPANQPVFWVSTLSSMRISADVDEEDIPRVATGQKVLIRADAFPGETFTGTVQSITPKGDPVSRSYRVRISLAEEQKFRIGMTTESNIIIAEKNNALLIPTRAVQAENVWIVENSKLKLKKIKTGLRGDEKTEVLSGLTEQDQVVADYDENFIAGRKVRPRLKE